MRLRVFVLMGLVLTTAGCPKPIILGPRDGWELDGCSRHGALITLRQLRSKCPLDGGRPMRLTVYGGQPPARPRIVEFPLGNVSRRLENPVFLGLQDPQGAGGQGDFFIRLNATCYNGTDSRSDQIQCLSSGGDASSPSPEAVLESAGGSS